MPWAIRRRDGKFCVVKEGETEPVPGGCHPTMHEARQHQKALYANEPSASASTVPAMKVLTVADLEHSPFGMTDQRTNGTEQPPAIWEGILGVEGLATDDGRYLMPEKISERELPLPLMAQFSTEDGHKGAQIAGKITETWRVENEDLGPHAVEIWGRGPFDDGEFGQEAARLVESEVLRGVSLDLSITEVQLLDPETLEPVEMEDFDLLQILGGGYLQGISGKIMGATLCAHPAFEQASLTVVGKNEAVVGSAFGMSVIREALTAAAAGRAPLKPPRTWFEMPEPDLPTPLTVTDEGQVFGHLALWGQCHTGFSSCETPPRSRSGYKFFHLGEVECDDGYRIPVGRVTVGKAGNARGGHASVVLGTKGALEHYDQTGCGAAFVRARDGRLGIWLCGTVSSSLSAERIRDLRAYPPSGDWRPEKGGLELVAVLTVPVPGFPIPRTEMRLVASGAADVDGRVETEIAALIASGYTEETEMEKTRAEMRQEALALASKNELRQFALAASTDGFADITAEQRRRWAKSGVALPDGSFPITKCTGDGPSAINARRAIGRAPEAKRGRVEAHIARREKVLNCSND